MGRERNLGILVYPAFAASLLIRCACWFAASRLAGGAHFFQVA